VPGVGTRKLQDLLVDHRVPRARRRLVPVVTAGDDVVWVPGIARSAAARLGAETVRVLDATLYGGEVFGLPVKNRCGNLVGETRESPARRR
jgi:tRNA(Ile)-lysidine synthetase-like protein